MCFWRVCSFKIEAEPHVNMPANGSEGQTGHEVVLIPTAVSWPGMGLYYGRETQKSVGLGWVLLLLGPLMAFQVWGCHLSARLISTPRRSISFHNPSLHHQRKSTVLWTIAAGMLLQESSSQHEKHSKLQTYRSDRGCASIVKVRKCIY